MALKCDKIFMLLLIVLSLLSSDCALDRHIMMHVGEPLLRPPCLVSANACCFARSLKGCKICATFLDRQYMSDHH